MFTLEGVIQKIGFLDARFTPCRFIYFFQPIIKWAPIAEVRATVPGSSQSVEGVYRSWVKSGNVMRRQMALARTAKARRVAYVPSRFDNGEPFSAREKQDKTGYEVSRFHRISSRKLLNVIHVRFTLITTSNFLATLSIFYFKYLIIFSCRHILRINQDMLFLITKEPRKEYILHEGSSY